MPSSSQDASIPLEQAPQSLTREVHGRFASFRDHYPRSSFTSVLESGPATNASGVAEYIVRATISLEGRPLVSSLASGSTLEEAEGHARLRNLDLAEAILQGSRHNSASASQVMDYGHDDGLGDTMVNLGPLNNDPAQPPVSNASGKRPKPKPKKSTAGSTPPNASEAAPSNPPASATAEPAAQEFVADWSDDLAQISVELKRLNWDSKQEQDYLQRTFNKSSRDDIVDHGELMDYLSYLQALPSRVEATAENAAEEDNSPIADAGLSVDEADLAPQSVSELMASAGLKSGAEIPTPPPTDPTVIEADLPAAQTPDASDETIVREPEPEIEIDSDDESEDAEALPPTDSLTRSEMMDETARLCKQLGWKNRQGSDFLKATYNKPTRKDLTDEEMMDFLEQLRSLSTTEALPY